MFEISGPYGETNVIEVSTDLANWSAIGTNKIPAFPSFGYGLAYFTNACSNCFYRVKSPDGIVASLNALGHMNVTAPPGYAMIANQLIHPAGNAVANLLPNVPDGSIVWKWNEAAQSYYDANEFVEGYGWYPFPNMTLNPGEGAIFQNPSANAVTLTFYGEVPQGYLLQSVPSALSIRSAILPQSGRLDTTLGYPVLNGDVISRMTGTNPSYTTYTYTNSQWTTPPGAPMPGIGESVWINTGTARSWGRTFSVWP